MFVAILPLLQILPGVIWWLVRTCPLLPHSTKGLAPLLNFYPYVLEKYQYFSKTSSVFCHIFWSERTNKSNLKIKKYYLKWSWSKLGKNIRKCFYFFLFLVRRCISLQCYKRCDKLCTGVFSGRERGRECSLGTKGTVVHFLRFFIRKNHWCLSGSAFWETSWIRTLMENADPDRGEKFAIWIGFQLC